MKHHDDMRECRDYIHAHLDEEIALDELAKRFYMSYSRFRTIFHEINGMTVHAFIRNRRLNRAAKELRCGKKVSDAAFDCGFKTLSGFSKAFDQLFGVSPLDYMRTQGAIVQKEPAIESFGPCTVAAYTFPGRGGEQEPAWWLGQDFSTVTLAEYCKMSPLPEGFMGNAEIGAWVDSGGGGKYAFGPVVRRESYIPAGMERIELPGGLYACFPAPSAKGVVQIYENVRSTAEYARRLWLPRSMYEEDAGRLLLEMYRGSESFICLPVKERA